MLNQGFATLNVHCYFKRTLMYSTVIKRTVTGASTKLDKIINAGHYIGEDWYL